MEHFFSIDPWAWAWLWTAGLWLWLTANALWPTYRPAWAATWSWACGWLTSELAPGHGLWILGGCAFFAALGAFRDWPGQVALAVSGVALVGTVALHRRAARTAEICAVALREAAVEASSEGASSRVDWGEIARPFPVRAVGVEIMRDIAYAMADERALRLDVYRSPARPTSAPVLVQIHGGAWKYGSKHNQGVPLMARLARAGWVCLAIEYRLAPAATFPDPLLDAKRALAWIHENVSTYGGDADFVAVTGGSAGAHLAVLLALTANDPAHQPGFEEAETRVDACVPLYGVYDLLDRESRCRNRGLSRLLEEEVLKRRRQDAPELFDAASPISHVRADAPPFFVLHGDHDTMAPVAMARDFVQALRKVAIEPVAYAELPGAHHAFDAFPSLRTEQATDAIHRFLAYAHARRQARRARPS